VKIPEHATLYLRPVEIELQCTDPLFVNPLLTALADEIGYYGISAHKLPASQAGDKSASWIEMPAQDVYRWRLYGIDDSLPEAWRLIVQRFVDCGWKLLDLPCASQGCPECMLVFSLDQDGGKTEAFAQSQYNIHVSGW